MLNSLKRSITLLSALVVISGCASSVATDYDASANFSAYKTFQFEDRGDAPLSLDGSRIQQAVNTELEMKGLSASEQNNDLVVRFDILEASELRADGPTFSFGIGSGSRHSRMGYGIGASTPTRVTEIKYGKIAVDLVDSETNEVVWRSISQRQLRETMKPADRQEFIVEQVHEMFKEYPVVTQ
ncbi:DUF4136 domain-containing protein [Vibrio agarivorans]|uniref:DUF4136 domain-containing protein n=1 Tax=Vibrio agarivorans TaxID=153622 RepID=UPI002231C10B|nr:DUF4136 domain-containing protein [Vibrio agarivorans]MDN3663123.1 DUF4136 domain-containing protein [Vibrio agarivorans]